MAFEGDTRPDAEAVQTAAIRARSPEARLRDAIELSELVHATAMVRLMALHPTKSVVELSLQRAENEAPGRVVR